MKVYFNTTTRLSVPAFDRAFESTTDVGLRNEQEDRLVLCPQFLGREDAAVAAVFDGTVGDAASHFCQQNFLEALHSTGAFPAARGRGGGGGGSGGGDEGDSRDLGADAGAGVDDGDDSPSAILDGSDLSSKAGLARATKHIAEALHDAFLRTDAALIRSVVVG
jgi:hypothetical protein